MGIPACSNIDATPVVITMAHHSPYTDSDIVASINAFRLLCFSLEAVHQRETLASNIDADRKLMAIVIIMNANIQVLGNSPQCCDAIAGGAAY